MAIPMMEEDVEVISKLGDVPGSDDGLGAQQIKERFDLGAKRIKNFLNNVLIPHMNQLIDVQALLDGILDTTLSLAGKAASAKETGERIADVMQAANNALPKSGGTMTGGINMSNKQLTNVPTPVNEYDAANKGYVDGRKVPVSIILPKGGWMNKTQIVANAAVTVQSEILFSYAPESVDTCRIADVRCVGQENGALTFTCRWIPAEDVTVNVIIWN